MKSFNKFLIACLMLLLAQIAIQAQTTGSISGTVVDQQGAVVPGATVTLSGEAGEKLTDTTNSSGSFNFASVVAGTPKYTLTISAPNFKTSVVKNVKVDVGTPATVNVALEVGKIEETVVITSGGEILQTETAKVGTTIQGRQILETPIASRDALDLVLLLPGTANVGRPRASSINGLPKGAITITVDGVDAQDNANRSTDGFFTYIRPRVDAIDEVTVSTSNPGAESGGDGAIQIKFVTRRGTNDYTGGVFWQHRNTALNANYWYNNRDKLPRQKIILNQYGGTFGGPIPFLGFGEGVRALSSGKDKRFFFVSHEEYINPESFTRSRTILTPDAQAGLFSYNITTPGGGNPSGCVTIGGGLSRCTRDLYAIALANSQLATPDPLIASLLARIRSAVSGTGVINPIVNTAGINTNPNRLTFGFNPAGLSKRNFFALRTDFVLTKSHSFEFVYNRQNFKPGKDFLNSREEPFPGFPVFGSQAGVRHSYTGALRSTFGSNKVNEVRYANSGGTTSFFPEFTPASFAFTGGFNLGLGGALGVTGPYPTNGQNTNQTRSTPTHDLTDSFTWTTGNHTINFGGQYKFIRTLQTNLNSIVPSVGFGIDSTEGTAFTMFNATTLPNSSTGQQGDARAIYAALIGRLSSYTSNAYLDEGGRYAESGPLTQEFGLTTFGIFAQDQWRIRQNFTVNFGLRWQPQQAFTIATGNVGRLEDWRQVYGTSGEAGIFQPGATGGVGDPRAILYKIGEKAYQDDYNNFAPSGGFVWSPDFGKGFLGRLFGSSGRSVFRGGYSRAFVREGSATQTLVTGNTPGGSIPLGRTLALGNFTVGTNLRTPGNPNLTTPTFSATPSFPLALTVASQAIAVHPDFKTGTVDSFSFGYQREVDKSTVLEVRYVGNRGKNLYRLNFVNETNVIENGFNAEFLLARANLVANVAANRCIGGVVPTPTNPCHFNFAYFGAATGTSPLPIMMSYFLNSGSAAASAAASLVVANYTSANFANTGLTATLNPNNLSPLGFVGSGSFENNATRRANAIANGRPANFFRVNPAVPAGSFLGQSDARSWYDSLQVELRRRLSAGLRVQASYVWSKSQSNAAGSAGGGQSNYTLRDVGINLAKNIQPFDIRHSFKFDATYDMPFGTGRAFFGNAGKFANAFVGGWTILPTVRWQSGSPVSIGNVTVVGMTVKELEQSIGVYKGPNAVTWLPDDIILNSQRAFDLSITGTGGFGGTTGGGIAPTGRFLAPAGWGGCVQKFSGDCGFQNLIVHAPSVRFFDMAIAKKIGLGERRSIELRTTILDVFNSPAFRPGGWAGDLVGGGCCGPTFGQMGTGSAYQDFSTTNNPGGRIIDLMLRINF